MGTMIQDSQPTAGDFEGCEGCNEVLNLTRPDIVAAIHRAYLEAGADAVTANTFGANLTALADYGLTDRIAELAGAGARLARAAADAASTADWPRFVLGSVGPGTKIASLGQVGYAQLRDAYQVQVEAMAAGGVDAVIIETSQDLLQTKAAVNGARRALRAVGRDLPVIAHVTIETTGTMLVGSDMSAVVASLAPLRVDGLGLNCATGPEEMREHLRQLARLTGLHRSAMPNAGLPQLTAAGAVYPLGPEQFAAQVARQAADFGLDLVGGCCGTTPDHIAALAQALAAWPSPARTPAAVIGPGAVAAAVAGPIAVIGPGVSAESGAVDGPTVVIRAGTVIGSDAVADPDVAVRPGAVIGPSAVIAPGGAAESDASAGSALVVQPAAAPWPDAVASTYSAVDLSQEVAYLAVGERANATGSKAFRQALVEERWEDCVELARQQVVSGAHVIDLSVDTVGRDGRADMAELAARLATAVAAPIMVDSTEPAVIAAGLERLPGRSIVNSVNFEDGDGPDSRYRRTMAAVVEHGAAVVALCIDEAGQARTAERKVEVARRLIADLTGTYGLALSDIIVDCLTFPIATGQDETRRDAIATLEAIRQLKAEFPAVHTLLGLSNVSFGLNPAARRILNSVFLDQARRVGLDLAIVHPGRIVALAELPEIQLQAALDLIHDRRRDGYDPLQDFLELTADVQLAVPADQSDQWAAQPVGERLRRRIVEALFKGLEADLDEALQTTPALTIINQELLAGMRTVGERFGSGQMQLPFVLKSAETMKRAVDYLRPHLGQGANLGKGTLVLATVRGDVHDIGKNLVDIILSNNGYNVVNLGIKQGITEIVDAAEASQADAIGLSGLLVKSTQVMRDNLVELNQRGLATKYPVLLGGAALTRQYVEDDLRALYQGEVHYAQDAFEGLRLMDQLTSRRRQPSQLGAADQSSQPEALLSQPGEPGAVSNTAAPPRPGRAVPEPGLDGSGLGQDGEPSSSLTAVPPRDGGPAAARRRGRRASGPGSSDAPPARSQVARGVVPPVPPFYGTQIVKGVALDEIVPRLDQRALFVGGWGLKAGRGGPNYDQLVAEAGRPRLRHWLEVAKTQQLFHPGVVYGYFPVFSDGLELVLLDPASAEDGDLERELLRFHFPRQRRPPWLALPDYFRDRAEAAAQRPDVLALQLVTLGDAATAAANRLFQDGAYRDYLEWHGLSVWLTEALAELWHNRVRQELNLVQPAPGPPPDHGLEPPFGRDLGPPSGRDPEPSKGSGPESPSGRDSESPPGRGSDQPARRPAARGARFSFGYPACPDLSQRAGLVRLLDPGRLGVTLSDQFQLHPEQSTDALIVHHPAAHYFKV
jgi:5-methyltetrahydrofolate--homocysteine methyltransferase